MKYSEPLVHQYNVFLVFLGVGFLLGFVYETVVFVRALLSKKKFAIIIQDVVFCFLTFLTLFFSFLAFSNGVIRFNLILSCAAGFLTFELSAGRAIKKLFDFLLKWFQKVSDILLRPFVALSSFLLKKSEKIKSNFEGAILKLKEKSKAKAGRKEHNEQTENNAEQKKKSKKFRLNRRHEFQKIKQGKNKLKKKSEKGRVNQKYT